jgi:rod shape-determining protein MreD
MHAQETGQGRGLLIRVALVCLLVQLVLVPYVGIGSGRANMALVFAGLVSLLMGGRVAVLCGFAAGLVYDLSTTGPMGLMSLLLTISSYFLGRESRNRLTDTATGSLATFGIHAALVTIAYHVIMVSLGQASDLPGLLVGRMLPSLVLTLLAYIPCVVVVQRVSGNSLQASKAAGRAQGIGSRYDLNDS